MVDRILGALARLPERLADWAGNLSAPALGTIGAVVMVGVAAGGYYAYETYDYVQHDNDFCMSCHLMQEPYDLFAESAHQGLGCKACHQPTLIARSQMALTQIVENPAEITAHAEVPNERCAHCHIDGDPEKWRLIANSAGHRVHLESADPVLEGLQCVECHATSVHEFAPIDRTCAQSGCHEDKKILLAGMSDLTIHCAGCHNFLAPVTTVAESNASLSVSLDRAILPDQEECFSCHTMRALVDMPDPDPHKGVCASCHNPHEQDTPAEAVRSCTNAGCHTDAAGLSPMHKGMHPGILEDCTGCHKAHDFKVEAERCLDCHQDLDSDSVQARARPRPDTSSAEPPHFPGFLGVGLGWWAHAAPVPQEAPRAQVRPSFAHAQHKSVDCRNCHDTQGGHGSLKVVTLDDCRSCHHRAPASNDCTRCHAPSDVPARTLTQVRPMELSVGRSDPRREMAFPHQRHGGLPCGSCHTQGPALGAANVDCTKCHEDHHEPEADCASCHRAPPPEAHPAEKAHDTCSGAACHRNSPFATAPRSRASCVVCHSDQKDHRPGRVCADCHSLPTPRAAGREAHP